ncbi:hypothetical protein ACHWQZ_G004628 [Mnemiopsis leidyi]
MLKYPFSPSKTSRYIPGVYVAKLHFVTGISRETTYELLINKPSGYTHDTVEYREGEKALLSPTVIAETYKWFGYSGNVKKRLIHSRRYNYIDAGKVLRINDLQTSDSGKYTVEMGFFGSIREEHFNIRVVDEEVPATAVSAILGRSAVLISNNTDTNMVGTWFRTSSTGQTQQVQAGENVVISQDGRVLLLHNISAIQGGRYFFRAGSETQSFQLTVLDEVQESVHYVAASGSVRFYFRVSESPKTVLWYYMSDNGQKRPITMSGRFIFSPDRTELKIVNPTREDAGNYIAKATFSGYTTNYTFTLTLLQNAYPISLVQVEAGHPASLQIPEILNSGYQTTWYRRDAGKLVKLEPIKGKMMMTEHHMVIEKTCGPDEGTYTAILDYGQHRQEINFNLQVSANSGTHDRTVLCSLNKKLVLRIEGVEEGAVRWFFTPLSDPSAEREVDKSAIPPNSRGMHLVLTRCSIEDRGIYRAHISSQGVSWSRRFFVDISSSSPSPGMSDRLI